MGVGATIKPFPNKVHHWLQLAAGTAQATSFSCVLHEHMGCITLQGLMLEIL
jgi:hypothetical protein